MSDLEKYADKMEIKKIVITMILSAFGFLLALQWRDVIKETIDTFMPPGQGLIYKYGVVIGLTILIAIITVILLKVKNMNIIPDKYEPQKRIAQVVKKRRKK